MRAAAFAARENASPGGGPDDAGSIEGEDPRASDEGRRRAGETVRIFRSGRSRAKTREDAASGWRRVAAAALDGDLARAEARLAEIAARESRDVAPLLALGRAALYAAHQSPERAGLEAAKAHAERLDELEQRLGARAGEAGWPR